MAGLNAEATVAATAGIIHDVGREWMLLEETAQRGKDSGFENPVAFYFAGRGGVLGDVDAEVVSAALGWFEPGFVKAMWEEGVAVAGAREAARRYGRACAAWGMEHLTQVPGGERLAELAARIIMAAEGSGLPLFAGWRAEPTVEEWPGRLAQYLHVLREWRGALHLVATTAVGLSPLEAILTGNGAEQARFFGWQGEFPDCEPLKEHRQQAEDTTDRLAALVHQRALAPDERTEYAELIFGLGATALQ
ncbi:SCO6745 family protein [Actinomadura opuntiae]|uniref:SCO6745 family protein n=1 Tax=Actinomadura sp. OS1-43 TaxID=604315 RepID=UPI00255AFBF0|nr:hypothetical protein [Actinomadura sp. OS1-43]MDL4821101.1 hypothetical protein [Actinomadura sp. OS1-43]